eukprot:GHVR01090769.1.p2 GENE.GHVR01090769.1~~GHVR01090769.1.p2  ORF type:complete len:142 (-),score=13.19 GHVR01090769.1:486-911(-)
MSHKYAFEALDTIMKQLRKNNLLMGGCAVLLSGDFRQILPIVRNGSRADHLYACLKSSWLWDHVNQLPLRINMRAYVHGDREAATFSDLLLQIGDGTIASDDSGIIKIPQGCGKIVNNSTELESLVYPDFANNYTNMNWLS